MELQPRQEIYQNRQIRGALEIAPSSKGNILATLQAISMSPLI